jgi:hypothetical protein
MTNWHLINYDGRPESRPEYKARYNRQQRRLFDRGMRRFFKAHPKELKEFATKVNLDPSRILRSRKHARRHEGTPFPEVVG